MYNVITSDSCRNSMGIPVVGTSFCVNVWQSNACLPWQHKHGASRSIVRRIGSYLPIDTGRRLFIQVSVPSMFIASAITATICHPRLHIDCCPNLQPYMYYIQLKWMHEQSINHISLKNAGLDVVQSYPLRRTHSSQYRPHQLCWCTWYFLAA